MESVMEKIERKPYRAPQITRVILRREQAVLSACSVGVTKASNGTPNGKCAANCKRSSSGSTTTVAS